LQLSPLVLVLDLYQFVILIFSLSVHESAHAWMASRLGDQTGRLEGRISLNPARHIDPVGTILYPLLMILAPLLGFGGSGILIGWGKPVPVITRNFQKITRDDNLVTLAGPIASLLLAFVAFLALVVLILAIPGGREAVDITTNGQIALDGLSVTQALALLGWLGIEVNLALVFFNLLPIPPLDASRFVRNMLPYNALNTFDMLARFGFVIIFILGRLLVNLLLGPATGIVAAALSLFLQHH
jgi:Zn-dependent protease